MARASTAALGSIGSAQPELYATDGAVPVEVLKARVEWLGRNPSHLGRDIACTCERKRVIIVTAAALLGVERAVLAAVLEERAPVTPSRSTSPSGWRRSVGTRQKTRWGCSAITTEPEHGGVSSAIETATGAAPASLDDSVSPQVGA